MAADQVDLSKLRQAPDPDAEKFEVQNLKLDGSTQKLLAFKAALPGMMGGAMGGAFSKLAVKSLEAAAKNADGVSVEVPKEGEKPGRAPEVWLTSDGKPISPFATGTQGAIIGGMPLE